MTKKDKKLKKARKSEPLAIAADAVAKQPRGEAKPLAKWSLKPHVRLDPLVREIIERIADQRTMVVLDVLAKHGTVRFTQLGKLAGGVSQKMLTKTVRQMEGDGLLKRTVHPVVPPHVDYVLTDLGKSLAEAFSGVWTWAEQHRDAVEKSRTAFSKRS